MGQAISKVSRQALKIVSLFIRGRERQLIIKRIRLNKLHKEGRVIFIGDIHGCYNEFLNLLQKINFNQKKDILILVGDLVNKGPNSCEVVEIARSIGALSVAGNHDIAAISNYFSGKWKNYTKTTNNNNKRHLSNHSNQTWSWVRNLTLDQVKYLKSLPNIIKIPELKLLIAHAGLVPGLRTKRQKPCDVWSMRYLKKRKNNKWYALECWEEGGELWAQHWPGPEHIIFGHDARNRLQKHPFATGLDTGCVYGNSLTAAVITADTVKNFRYSSIPSFKNLGIKLVSVKAAKVYYKGMSSQAQFQ